MKSRPLLLTISLTIVVLIFAPSASLTAAPSPAPLAGACVPGGAYDPACDVNHDSTVNILDIQLAAGHWGQSGAWLSDNNHNHLGQTWVGADNPLVLTGSYGAPTYAALALSNSASAGNGLFVSSAGASGIDIYSTGVDGLSIGSAGRFGVSIWSTGDKGMYINSTSDDGVFVYTAGAPSSSSASTTKNGFEVGGAQDNGLFVGHADGNGVFVNHADGYGLYVGQTGNDGVRISSTGDDGVQIGENGEHPYYGVYVPEPGTTFTTLLPNTAQATGEWALYTVDKIHAANVSLGAQTLVAVVGGDQPLTPGDVVAAVGLADPLPGSVNRLAQVRLATAEQGNLAGVVSSRMALQPLPGKGGAQELRSVDGAAQPGDYVAITVLGATQVKVPAGTIIQPGQRLTVAVTPGQARTLRTVQINGVKLDEAGPSLGVALEAARGGLVWVLVQPQ